mmetsp:Transcript_98894/g.284035  ORF Transcript_98894/g.284035 Transcript_98894/m.284035 type:complete len:778 (-) Transcript_98894:330-2663(-)
MGCSNGKLGADNKADCSGGSTKQEAKKESERLLDKYTLGKVLGQGAFGVVYACKKKSSNEEFAVKMVDQVETPLIEIRQEVDMLKKLAHPCVVKLHDVYYEKVFVCMVLEIYRGGDMIEGMQLHWKSKGMIPVPVVQNMSKMMFQGVDWLHQRNVVHRDLKGDNYLQDRVDLEHPSCRVYLSDFGTVVDLPEGERLKSKCGTKTYWSPEFYQLNYGLKVDIWGLGVVIFGMVTGRFPFKGEEDVRVKQVKIPSRCGKDGESFLKGTLERNEETRLSARGAIDHPFLAAIKSSAETLEPFDKDFMPEVKEGGANAGIRERRRELVERLENAQAKKDINPQGNLRVTHKDVAAGFQVYDKHAEKTNNFEWWSQAKCTEAKFIDDSKVRNLNAEEFNAMVETSPENIKQMLTNHSIVTENFGKGQAKTFDEFVSEIKQGQARLMLDASKHKNVVRVVDVILLRIGHGSGANKKYLTIQAEKYADGRMRPDIYQLAGSKKMPYENGIQAAHRTVSERLNMSDAQVIFDFVGKECFEEDESSPSYPGVQTVYRKEIFEGEVTTTDAKILERIGLGAKSNGQFNHVDSSNYTRFFCWLSETQCTSKSVKLRAPAEGADVSALVHPPIGFEEEELQKFLQDNNIDVTKFGKEGTKTLAEFSEELVKGEAALSRKANGSIIRVVDVVILKVHRKNGDWVVEVGEVKDSGAKKDLNRLPAVKRREDENPFWAAHRVMSKVLRISENLVTMDHDNMQLVEEEKDSQAYAGLPTLYRRRIISAMLNEP